MKQTWKKIASRKGMTLTEVLMAVLILSLATVAVSVGVRASMGVQRQSVDASDAQLLVSTISTALMDELRYARAVDADGSFTSSQFGQHVSVGVNGDGHITIGGQELLGSGAYGDMSAAASVSYSSGMFRVSMRVLGSDGAELRAEAFSVKPLNRQA